MSIPRIVLAAVLWIGLIAPIGPTLLAPAEPPQHTLMPVPAEVQFGTGRLTLRAPFTAAVKGYNDDRLRKGIERAVKRLEQATGLRPARRLPGDAKSAALVVECRGAGKAVPALDEDESYTLDVSTKQAVLSAPTVVGALRGLETFLQLVEGDRGAPWLPVVQIRDRPRFPWRGLLIDVSRHFQPVAVIERNLDGMAAVKLNVLHWHLSDDQGFRIESRRYPRLHQMGSDQQYYTQQQVRGVIAYARDRGIRVVPEFDMPAHTTSWLVGHPELASAPGPYEIARTFGIKDGVMDPTREEVYRFLDAFLGEMAALFPDAYLHIGGDENNGRQWSRNAEIQAFMRAQGIADNRALQTAFNQRIAGIVTKHGKKMMGWDEILNPGLPKDVVVHSWRGQASLFRAAKEGYPGVLSSGYYLDQMSSAARHYAVDPLPAGSGLSAPEAARVLGGEACMWGEYVTPEIIDSRIWPRLAAIAERLWSPAGITDVADMYRRLDITSHRLGALGLTHESAMEPMLRRLAGPEGMGPLRTLAELVEPVTFSRRGRGQQITTQTALTGLVDAARPDSAAARHVAALVDGLLSDAPRFRAQREELRQTLTRWRDLRPELERVIASAPDLREAAPLAADLAALSSAGLEALEALSTRPTPDAAWRDARLDTLQQAARPKAAVLLAVVPAVRQLVIGAAEVDQLQALPPAAWKERVAALANTGR